jgi:hypothetical protein
MKRRFLLVTVACAALLSGVSPSLAEALDNPMREVALADSELEELRGGFLLAGGLVIDFALYQQTVIDGELRRELQLSTQNLMQTMQPEDFRTVIQIGEGNVGLGSLAEIPGIVTVIQNTMDNTMIQNLSNLDIAVANLAAIRQDINTQLEAQISAGLR